MSIRLRTGLLVCGKLQYEIAAEAGLSESRFSRIVCGRIIPTADEKARIALVMRRSVETLFDPDHEVRPFRRGGVEEDEDEDDASDPSGSGETS